MDTPDDTPLHLRDRQPFVRTAEMILRRPATEVLGEDGKVVMAGAIEFQTTITPGVLTDICDPEELYKATMRDHSLFRVVYDAEIQRGIKESKGGLKEFLRPSEIEAMMKDIEENQFECPQLIWNLRAGETVWVYVRATRELRVYQGVATRPDTNHRHHAIIKTHRLYRAWVEQTQSSVMGNYNADRAYGLVIYTDDFRARPTGSTCTTSWAGGSRRARHFIESKTREPHIHSRMARELMERSQMLGAQNVELLSNHLSRNSAKMLTFGTMVDALRNSFPNVIEDNYPEVVDFLLAFLEALGKLRPRELVLLSVAQRQTVRNASVVDQAVLWHGYIRLAAWARENKVTDWAERLEVLNRPYRHVGAGNVIYSGDLFGRDNPRWQEVGVIAPGKTGPRVVNNRQARQGAFELLRDLVHEGSPQLALA